MMLSLWLFIAGGFGIGITAYYMVLKRKYKTGRMFSGKLTVAVLADAVLACVMLAGAVCSLFMPDAWRHGDVGYYISLFSIVYMCISMLVFSAVGDIQELYREEE